MVLPFAIGSKLVPADSVAIPKLWAGQTTTELFWDMERQDNSTSHLCFDMLRYQNGRLTELS